MNELMINQSEENFEIMKKRYQKESKVICFRKKNKKTLAKITQFEHTTCFEQYEKLCSENL